MNFELSEYATRLLKVAKAMIQDEIAPLDDEFLAEVSVGNRWNFTPRQKQILETLKASAKCKGLWNLWLNGHDEGANLTTVEYTYFAEEMGKSYLAPEVFNCNAPDTGNMETLLKFGTEEMQRCWLKPLLEGTIRSAYLMTEPDVASSDATNLSLSCIKDGKDLVLNGEKWWATGAGDPRCAVYIVMVRTKVDGPRHGCHSMVVVPSSTDGIQVLRPMQVYGSDDAPHGHMHIRFSNVRVPSSFMLAGEGRGFEVAQSRLGPGRLHHCMRAIGQAEKALTLLCRRSLSRKAFGKPVSDLGANHDIIARSRTDIESARLLCLKAAAVMDLEGARSAAPWVSIIKSFAPEMALNVTDQAIQIFGAEGLSQDTPLARQWQHLRTLRLADGPDAVHRRQVARAELRKYQIG